MKELFQNMMKKLRKHSEAAGAIAALLLIVLFSGVMILGIRTQRESVPENPIDGMEKSSMVMLTGTKEVLAVRKSGYTGDGERIVKRKRS